jgi:peptidyl-prolyl cis-trans isomerase A (cyclophilin A)
MRTFFLVLCVFLVFSGPAAQAGQPSQQGAAPTPARTTHMTSDPALLHPATLNAKAPDTFDVKFETTKGEFVVTVTRSWSPLGADRFYNLVKHGFFSGAPFFRVVPGFIVQFGLTGDPAVNKVWRDANIKDDRAGLHSNAPGTIVFATAGPNTRTTQLFINYGANAFLDSQGFTPFGEVTSGMDVVKNITKEYGERPDQGAITMQGKAYVEKNFPNIDSIKSATIVAPAH